MIAHAAGITGTLAAAGLPESEIHAWFDTTRRELGGMTPRETLQMVGPRAGERVLAIARADARGISRVQS